MKKCQVSFKRSPEGAELSKVFREIFLIGRITVRISRWSTSDSKNNVFPVKNGQLSFMRSPEGAELTVNSRIKFFRIPRASLNNKCEACEARRAMVLSDWLKISDQFKKNSKRPAVF